MELADVHEFWQPIGCRSVLFTTLPEKRNNLVRLRPGTHLNVPITMESIKIRLTTSFNGPDRRRVIVAHGGSSKLEIEGEP
jgi:hypothetical protein